jgi:hypothetical protein
MCQDRRVSASLQHHPVGVSWIESGAMARTAHALADGGRVWLIDPFEDSEALEAAAQLGEAAAVVQLLDRHERDCERIAARLGVPWLRLPSSVPESPFTVVPVVARSRWNEIALWWDAQSTLIVPEAIGTGPYFAAGRRAGVHPMLRLLPPRAALGSYAPQRLLVGHGPPVLDDAAAALSDALKHSRDDIPKLILSLPGLIRGSR